MLAMPKCAIVRGRAPFSERTFPGQAKFVHQLMMTMGAGSVCCRPDRSCHLPRTN